MKKSVKITACFTTLACLLISGCGDSSKDQSIVFYDCSSSTEKDMVVRIKPQMIWSISSVITF